MTPYSVYACETQPIVLEGLRSVLASSGDFRLVGSSPCPAAALEEIAERQPDIFMLDHGLGWPKVHALTTELRSETPETKAVVWGSVLDSADGYRAIQIGVRGVFQRHLPIGLLLECLFEVVSGRVWFEGAESALESHRQRQIGVRLTPREREIVELVAQGLKNREIAEQLAITTGTVKVHLMHVFEKTAVSDRYELAMQARGLLEESGTR